MFLHSIKKFQSLILTCFLFIAGCSYQDGLLELQASDEILEIQDPEELPDLTLSCPNDKWKVQHSTEEFGEYNTVEDGTTLNLCDKNENYIRFIHDSPSNGGVEPIMLYQIWHPNPNASPAATRSYFENLDNMGVYIRTFAFCLTHYAPISWVNFLQEPDPYNSVADICVVETCVPNAETQSIKFTDFHNPTQSNIRISLKLINPTYDTNLTPNNQPYVILNIPPSNPTGYGFGPWEIEFIDDGLTHTEFADGDYQEIRMRAVYKGCDNPGDASFLLKPDFVTGIDGAGPIFYHTCVNGEIQYRDPFFGISYAKEEMDGQIDFSVFVGCQDCLPDGCTAPCWRIDPEFISLDQPGLIERHWVEKQAGPYWAYSCY